MDIPSVIESYVWRIESLNYSLYAARCPQYSVHSTRHAICNPQPATSNRQPESTLSPSCVTCLPSTQAPFGTEIGGLPSTQATLASTVGGPPKFTRLWRGVIALGGIDTY